MNKLPEPATPASLNSQYSTVRSLRSDDSKALRFDAESRRWCIGDWELHCGDAFKLLADDATLPAIPVRIEHSNDFRGGWYLITPYGLTLPSCRRATR